MLKSCPDPVDVQDILFKLRCRLKVFDNKDLNSFLRPHSLISCASRYGLLFVGSNSKTLQAIQLKCVENYSLKDKDINNYPRRNLNLQSPPIHVCVNCDSTILAIVLEKDSCSTVIFYDVLSFYKQNIAVIKELKLSSTPGVTVIEVNWNPALPATFTACKSDGTLGVYELKGNAVDINELPTAAETTSFCWSPKGKQIAVGSRNGKITQYKPDLKAVKIINEPPLEGPHSLISLQWVSNYQFIGVYRSADPEVQAKLVVVDSPKTGETSYTNYDDVCYSGNSRIPQFYMIVQQHWNILLVSSSNSTEVGVLGSVADTWTQWIISDSARAELPLSADKQDTLPVGLALDISPSTPLPWGEGTIPPCPYLLILSHHGVLCIFDIVNLMQGVPSICSPVENVQDTSGLAQFVVGEDKASVKEKDTAVIQPQSTFGFGTPQITASGPQTFAAPQASLFKTQNVNSGQSLINPSLQPKISTPLYLFGSTTLNSATTEQKLSFTKPSSSLFSSKTDTPTLFSGQVPLSAAKTSQPPSFVVGETIITPATMAQTPVTTSNKYSSILAALHAPISTPSSAQSKPVIVSELPRFVPTSNSTLIHSAPVTSTSQIPKAEPKSLAQPLSVQPKQVSDPKVIVDEKVKEETDALLAKMVRDECVALDSELKALLHQGRRLNIHIGSDEEKLEMLKRMETLEEFIKEIVDISCVENAEVHNLKQNLILSWAWYEEALSRYNVSKDETMTLILKSQPLNSASEKRQSDMRKLIYYLESQLSQVNMALDEQWEKFQDYAKKTHRVQMPTMEAIFQSMVRQNAVLQRQVYILKDISSRIKQKKLSSSGPSLFLTLDDGTKKIENDLKRLQIEPEDPRHKIYEKTLKKGRHFTATKKNKLHKFLKMHDVVHITVIKPQLNSTLPVSPASKSKQIYSILGAQMSPVKASLLRNSEFFQSTPIRENKTDMKPTNVPPNTPAHTESQKSFAFTNLKTNVEAPLSITGESDAINLLQNINRPVSSNAPSAFVSTTQSTKVSNFPQISETAEVTGNVSTPAFSFASVATGTIPKTNTESLLSNKSNTPQFNFGNSITITPINPKYGMTSSLSLMSTVSSTKPTFSFAGTSNMFGSRANTDVTVVVPKSTTSISTLTLGTISQSKSVPLFGVVKTTPISSFSFGSTASTIVSSSEISAKTSVVASVSGSTSSTKSGPFGPSSTVTPTFLVGATVTTNATITTSTLSAFTVTPVTKPSIFGSIPSLSKSDTSSSVTTTTGSTSFFSSSFPTLISSSETASVISNKPETASAPFASTKVTSSTATSVVPTSSLSDTKVSSSTSILSNVTNTSSFGTSSISTPSIFAAINASVKATTSTSTGSIFSFSNISITPVNFGSEAPITSGSSLFGSISSSTNASIFGGSSTSTTNTTSTPIFGASSVATASGSSSFEGSSSLTSRCTTTPILGNSTVSSTSIFGESKTLVATSTSIFGTNTSNEASSSIFGNATSLTKETPGFGGTTTQTQVFGTPTATKVFSSTPTTTSQQGLIFGGGSTTQTSIFGTISTSSTQPSIFGLVTSATSTQSSIFASATTSASQVFGTVSTTQPSIFGSITSTATTQPSVFASTTTGASQLFGTVSTTSTQPSIFGSITTTSQPSIFASPTTNASQVFGNTTTTQSSFGSSFGQTGSIFATPKTTSSTFGSAFGSTSIFGSTPATTAQGFGQTAAFSSTPTAAFGTTTTANSIFGSGGTSFGSVSSSSNVFGSTAPASTFSFASAASNATTGTGTFGFSSLSVGNAATTSSSIFGGENSFAQRETAPANPFGSGTSIFGSPSSTSSTIFGTNTSNTQAGFGTSTFGSPSSFGQQPTFGQSTFGSTAFGNPQAGPFTAGGTGVGQTGFGTSSFHKPSGFGGAPAFGGSPQPAFGASPSFGGAPAFGAAPTFGSPTKVFGSNTPTAAFGSAATGSPGFGNMAAQNTVGFGNLAQQAATSTSTPFAGNSSFSSWR